MTGPKDFQLQGVGQIGITVKDIVKAASFYRDTLGLPMMFEGDGMAFFNGGGVRIMMAQAEGENFDHPASILYYKVDDLNKAYAELQKKGVKFEQEPRMVHETETMTLRMAFLRDVDDNILGLMSERMKVPKGKYKTS